MKKIALYRYFIPGLIIFTTVACGYKDAKRHLENIYKKKSNATGIRVTYPFNQTIFPPEFYPPTFSWEDTTHLSANKWFVFIHDSSGEQIFIRSRVNTASWRPDSIEWERLKKSNSSGHFIFTVMSYSPSTNQYATGQVNFSFSRDSVGADIFFRAVTLPFSFAVKNVHTIEWYMGSVKGGRPRLMLKDMPVCGNCHSFPAGGKPILAMDVDYGNDKGSYTIAEITNDTCRLKPDNIITWSDFKREEHEPTFGLLSQISPDGNYVLSTVKDLSVFVAVDDNMAYSQLFFPIKGIIGVYDRQNRNFFALSGADNPKYVQSNPSWSPDGQEIIFARTDAYINEKVRQSGRALLSAKDVKEFTSRHKTFKFDLYRIKFNEGKGGIPEPIEGASANGKSNYFAKYSPDGKWIVFCQADNFMLLQPDAQLYIMPAKGGKPRRMNCNLPSMNSWHSWSPNSRWLVFSSKYKGLYTQLYLTHIDENGNDSPPVLLENLLFEKRAANIPEFYPAKAENFKAIKDEFSRTAPYFVQLSADNMVNGFYRRAWNNLEEAIRLDSNYLEAYFQRILLNATLRQTNSLIDRADKQKALQLVDKLLAQHPNNDELLLIKATLLSSRGETDKALLLTDQILKINPKSYKTYELVASIYRKTNQYQRVWPVYDKMISLVPHNAAQIDQYRVDAYVNLGRYHEALALISRLIEKYPYLFDLRAKRVEIALQTGNRQLALKDLEVLMAENSDDETTYELLARFYIDEPAKSESHLHKTIAILNKKLDSSPEDITLLLKKANILSVLRNWRQADETLSRILELFPFNYEALKQKAKLKLVQKQWAEAVSLYNRLEKYYPAEEEFFNNRAIALINLGRLEEALTDFDRTLQINPTNTDAISNKSKLLKMLGKNNI
ncbi:MAG: tetratricopeptide repeat protein [Bacteroidales bacterium]|nr:tetratricopeptide repeat protein [Bacteroidales bacterium]